MEHIQLRWLVLALKHLQRTLQASAYQVLNNKLSKKTTIISFHVKDFLRLQMDINNSKVSISTYNAMLSVTTENLQF